MKEFNSIWTLSVLMVFTCSAAQRLNREVNYTVQQPLHIEPQFVNSRIRSYMYWREVFLEYEESKSLGADILLSNDELKANEIIMKVKTKEYKEGLAAPHLFAPSRHLFEVLNIIKNSTLFKYISPMPKGTVLHAHDTALCSTDCVIRLTYRKYLWACVNNNIEIKAFRFSKIKPSPINSENDCSWQLLSQVRKIYGACVVDYHLRKRLTLFPTMKFLDNNEAWKHFLDIFGLLDGLLFYAPVWSQYYYNALKEFYADGVQYLEFRTTLPILYDLRGTNYTEVDTVRIYNETLHRFLMKYPDFVGSKLIYAPLRNTDKDGMEKYIKICTEIKRKYPDFVAGFDLVGQEEMGRPLKYFVPQLLKMPKNIDFFFHAGETNWFGSSVDENLIDAILLGTKRIGHGFALVKHPLVLHLLKERDIAIEVNPISNQVLQLVSDYRNHPCSYLFANDYPVVISSDDPSFWKATPLSHDFYIAFLGIASAHSDLKLLKKLAVNSIIYSSMNNSEKTDAIRKWKSRWDEYIQNILNGDI